MQGHERRVYELLAPTVASMGYELLGLVLNQGQRHSRLTLFIDREGGVGIGDCERVSQRVSGLLDVEDPIVGEYALEVSSPGVDRPLFSAAHFERFVGSRARVRLSIPRDGRRNFVGSIVAVEDGRLRLATEEGETELALTDVASARLVPDWDAGVEGPVGGRR